MSDTPDLTHVHVGEIVEPPRKGVIGALLFLVALALIIAVANSAARQREARFRQTVADIDDRVYAVRTGIEQVGNRVGDLENQVSSVTARLPGKSTRNRVADNEAVEG